MQYRAPTYTKLSAKSCTVDTRPDHAEEIPIQLNQRKHLFVRT